LNTSIYTGLD